MGRFREQHTAVGYPIYLGQIYNWDYVNDCYIPGLEKWYGNYSFQRNSRPTTRDKYCWDALHPGPPYKTGGPLSIWTRLDHTTDLASTGVYENTTKRYKYVGGFISSVGPGPFFGSDWGSDGAASATYGSFGDVSADGATGWSRYRPGRPSADLGVFLGELKDLPRMLKTTASVFHKKWRASGGSRSNFGPKNVANHWLNTQFGWFPFLHDMRRFYNTTKNLEQQLNQLQRDNAQWIKRGGTVDKTEDTDEESMGSETSTAHYPILTTSCYRDPYASGTGSYRVIRNDARHTWFKARWRYHIPDIGTVKWRRRAVRQMYGLSISPSLLWELTPWSWLVDWCSNFGDVISNLDNGLAENLAAKYAYVMGTTCSNYTVESTADLVGGALTNSWSFSIERKERSAASPFGFGLTSSDFSGRQWSILSALGLSRLR